MSSKSPSKESNQQLNAYEVISTLSHELRSPLNPIIGFSQILLDGLDGDLSEDAEQDVRAIYSGAQTLLMLLDSLVDWTRLESGKLMISRDKQDLTEVIRAFFRQEMALQTPRIQLEIEEKVYPPVSVDKGRIRQVLRHVLQSVLTNTKEVPITLRCTQPEADTLRVSVSGFAESDGFNEGSLLMKRLLVLKHRQLEADSLHGETLALHVAQRLIMLHDGEMGLTMNDDIAEEVWFTLPVDTGDE